MTPVAWFLDLLEQSYRFFVEAIGQSAQFLNSSAAIVHLREPRHSRSAATTGLWAAGSPPGPSVYCESRSQDVGSKGKGKEGRILPSLRTTKRRIRFTA